MTTHTDEQRELEQHERRAVADRLYEQYGKPLEADHWGEYVAIAPDGRTLIGDDDRTLLRDALRSLGPGGHTFRIGPRAMGRGPSILRQCP